MTLTKAEKLQAKEIAREIVKEMSWKFVLRLELYGLVIFILCTVIIKYPHIVTFISKGGAPVCP